tara:strand:- start:364 stop:1242 length:879 start_codon:yes stop_codon:yes gene_type:complete
MKDIIEKLWINSPKNICNSIINKLTFFKSKVPFNYSLNSILQNKKHLRTDYLIDRWERYFRVIENNTGDKYLKNKFNFQGKKILELGCGPLFGWGPIAIFLGAATYYFHEPALNDMEVKLSKELKERYFLPLYLELKSEFPINISFSEFYDKVMSKCLPMDFNNVNNIDLILSNSVLEHIPFKGLNSLLSGVHKTCNEKALYMHAVDFGSHGKGGSGFGSLYRNSKNNTDPMLNLLRKSDIEKCLIDNGFSLMYSIIYRSEDIDRNNIAPSWSDYSDIDLSSKVVFFIGGIK